MKLDRTAIAIVAAALLGLSQAAPATSSPGQGADAAMQLERAVEHEARSVSLLRLSDIEARRASSVSTDSTSSSNATAAEPSSSSTKPLTLLNGALNGNGAVGGQGVGSNNGNDHQGVAVANGALNGNLVLGGKGDGSNNGNGLPSDTPADNQIGSNNGQGPGVGRGSLNGNAVAVVGSGNVVGSNTDSSATGNGVVVLGNGNEVGGKDGQGNLNLILGDNNESDGNLNLIVGSNQQTEGSGNVGVLGVLNIHLKRDAMAGDERSRVVVASLKGEPQTRFIKVRRASVEGYPQT
ncbi:uncharacterized protein PFL1_05340 [Pseudozyma flocculosa PF-1]|uniref:Hyphally-regulated cell wall protein N-terminal domain-containing protein n=1 Tax=Pseudozyma flocculosa PF-1 TaxID=1277687 RepID=A0A061H906_9BASI|nr:uncharacterized protein PFL1_05340 [Pseudozyma flocculosa PF-1]EPQ27056.1 hypothetical protein PFL1_05340 [Pseudozyma flocculosa PF-1]